MKFMLKEAITKDAIFEGVRSYIQENDGKHPSYLLIHPETRYKLIIGETAEDRGLEFRGVWHTMSATEGLNSTEKVFDLWIIRSENIEPDFMIICG